MKKILLPILLVLCGCISLAQDTIKYEIIGVACNHTNNLMVPIIPTGLVIVSQDSVLFYSKRYDINPIDAVKIDSKDKSEDGVIFNLIGTRNDESEYTFTIEIREKVDMIKWTMIDNHEIYLKIKRLN